MYSLMFGLFALLVAPAMANGNQPATVQSSATGLYVVMESTGVALDYASVVPTDLKRTKNGKFRPYRSRQSSYYRKVARRWTRQNCVAR